MSVVVLAGGTGAEAFFTLGMWRAARLEMVPATHLERPFLVTESASAEDATLSLTVEVLAGTHSLGRSLHPWDKLQLDSPADFARLPARQGLSGGTTLRVDLTPVGETRAVVHEEWPLDLLEGRNWVTRKIKVARPKLWWPNGLGESARYTVNASIDSEARYLACRPHSARGPRRESEAPQAALFEETDDLAARPGPVLRMLQHGFPPVAAPDCLHHGTVFAIRCLQHRSQPHRGQARAMTLVPQHERH